MTVKECIHLPELLEAQIPALEQAVKRNEYYLGETCRHYIGNREARKDFFKNHLQQYWGEIFKALYCRFKCPDGLDCEVVQNNECIALAEKFEREVHELGIDKILMGGDETERIFSAYKKMVDRGGA